MKSENEIEEKQVDDLCRRLATESGNLRRTGDTALLHAAGLMLVAGQVLGELIDAKAALLRSVARAAPALPLEAAEVSSPGVKPDHRHKFEGEPPTCSVCGKVKGKGGRPPEPNPERASATDPAFANKKDGPSLPLPGAVAADRYLDGAQGSSGMRR